MFGFRFSALGFRLSVLGSRLSPFWPSVLVFSHFLGGGEGGGGGGLPCHKTKEFLPCPNDFDIEKGNIQVSSCHSLLSF